MIKGIAKSVVVVCVSACSQVEAGPQSEINTAMQIARDGNIAIHEEFDATVLENTVAAYELFIARHPDHELAKQALLHLTALKSMEN